jgi:hypothetical protein
MTDKENPAPRANAGGRAHHAQQQYGAPSMKSDETRDFATLHVARRYRLPVPIAAVVARLAELGGVLS